MTFYQRCLGGTLIFQTIGESGSGTKMPAKMKNCILHSELRNGKLLIMASDMVGESGLLKGNSISLMLNCGSEKELRECYLKLSQDGTRIYPLKVNKWKAVFGGITDKYGNTWMLRYQKNHQ
jgi:PhnB protein